MTLGNSHIKMKRRHRRHVLDINGSDSDIHRNSRRWHPHERQASNGSPSNSLSGLVGQYSSDGEADDTSKPKNNQLNDQVNDFLKEIQQIAPNESSRDSSDIPLAHPGSFWQECYDEQTGYPYYWHTETNQVTWEIPPELKLYKEKRDGISHSNIPLWSKMANKLSETQNNIPDGMIPKDVVARNRNRQAGIVSKPDKSQTKSDNSKSNRKEDSSDDEKIEMITSFGNEESESEEEEEKKPPLPLKPPLPPVSAPQGILKKSLSRGAKPDKQSETKPIVGPMLPPVQFGPHNQEKINEKLSQQIKNDISSKEEDDILNRLKSQAKLLQTRNSSSTINSSQKSGKDLKLSLVPGYEDDSETEEDSPRKSTQSKPLFPITEQTSETVEKLSKRMELTAGSVRIYEYKKKEGSLDKSDEKTTSGNNGEEKEKSEETKEDLDTKANKFLDNIEMPSKRFQRKPRIAFDVVPNKSKSPEKSPEPNVSISEPGERLGLGFSKEESTDAADSPLASETNGVKKPMGIAFVKSSSTEETSNSSNASATNEKTLKETTEEEKAELKSLTEPVVEKLKFLSEGSPTASPVQIMAIQIQTLLSAWETGDLQSSYLRNWLQATGCELTRLEQTAAPPGWECQWDRSQKRYYYRNSTTNEAQWTYPQTDVVGGTEEMELCTTPPPPEQEETPIIEMNSQPSKEVKVPETIKPPPPPTDEPAPPPPPPMISSPSPPPPPKIYAEDLKVNNRKRKESPNILQEEANEMQLKPVPEPLPPGVENPELAHHYAIDPTGAVIYSAHQQPHPIYAATLAGAAAAAAAGLPLLQHPHHHHHHPHPALVQGQLVHYSPAYHQHLHNQALVAARISNQEAAMQFMVAEYARAYENNQVIAKPPVKVTSQEANLGSAINSFYSDIAAMEKAEVDQQQHLVAEASSAPVMVQMPLSGVDGMNESEAMKDKKRKKMKTGLSKKQKEMSSMVAKWQRAQKNYKDCD